MANRCMLAINKLENFKQWLLEEGWNLEPVMGFYEIVRARKGKRVLLVYRKNEIKEHVSVPDSSMDVVKKFIQHRNNMGNGRC